MDSTLVPSFSMTHTGRMFVDNQHEVGFGVPAGGPAWAQRPEVRRTVGAVQLHLPCMDLQTLTVACVLLVIPLVLHRGIRVGRSAGATPVCSRTGGA